MSMAYDALSWSSSRTSATSESTVCPSRRPSGSSSLVSTISRSSMRSIRNSKIGSSPSGHRPRARGRCLHGTRGRPSPNPWRPNGQQTRADSVPLAHGSIQMTDIPELTDEQLERAIPARLRRRLMQGRFESGEDIAALRSFVGLTQAEFARAIAISVHTLRNWEQGRRKPEGPAIALLRIAARHPRILRENLESAA